MCSRNVLHAIARLVAVLSFSMEMIETAHAQSFFETMFGGPKSANAHAIQRAPGRLLLPSGATGINAATPYSVRPTLQHTRGDNEDDRSMPPSGDRGRSYRTVCVRMCDGFYWPVSFAVTRGRFYRDANICSSSCTSEAKLFYFPGNGGHIEDAVDLTGRVYSRLPAAFKYRKVLIHGCKCKPEAWSEAETDRHRNYAAKEETGPHGSISPARPAEYPVPPPSGSQAAVVAWDALDDGPQSAAGEAAVKATDPIAVAKSKTPKALVALELPRADLEIKPTVRLRQRVASPQPVSSKYVWPGDGPVRVR